MRWLLIAALILEEQEREDKEDHIISVELVRAAKLE